MARFSQSALRSTALQQQKSPQWDFDAVSEIFARLVLEAGVAVMKVYSDGCKARTKSDMSPVCDADEQAEAIILAGLANALPGIPVIAEEAAARGDIALSAEFFPAKTFILVDPLDGTREFLNKNGEFTINIALIVDGVPKVGAVFAPALDKLWFAGDHAYYCAAASGASLPSRENWQALHARTAPDQGLVALASRSHPDSQTQAFLARLTINEQRTAGSSLKFCILADGGADVYPRFGPTMEWDIAAGDAILRAAGGMVLDTHDMPMPYGKSENQFRNGGFIAWADPMAAIQAAG